MQGYEQNQCRQSMTEQSINVISEYAPHTELDEVTKQQMDG